MSWPFTAALAGLDVAVALVFIATLTSRRGPVLGFVCAACSFVLTAWLLASVAFRMTAEY